MTSIADSSVSIQTSSESVPSTPCWLGEVVLIVEHLRKQGVLAAINERVRFARRRFGHYEVIDFWAVLFGYALSGERTLEAFYERLIPWAETFMALFNREQLPSRSALSRFLASFTPVAVESLRALFLEDLLARPSSPERQRGELRDRAGGQWEVFDIDGTREAARQRALPKMEDLPEAGRRLDEVCAAGYTGRKRGEVVRTRTVVSQAHTSQWLGSFGNMGNGEYRKELEHALGVIRCYLAAHSLPQARALLRLDGLYGTGAVIADLADLCFVMRGKDYTVLDHPTVQARLHLPPDTHFSRPESGLVRQLYDCPDVPVGKQGCRCRVVVATHPAASKKSRIGQPARASATNSFSPGFRKTGSPPPMWSHCICIVVPLNQCSAMRTSSKTPTAGAVTRLLDKKPGRSSRSGCGTCGWNWVMCLSRLRYARLSLLRPSLPPQRPERIWHPRRAMTPLRLLRPGKQVVSLGRTSPSSQMGQCAVRLTKRLWRTSNAEKPMEASVWSMQPVSAVAAPALCVTNANGRGTPRRNRGR